jgi:hypothetical protein
VNQEAKQWLNKSNFKKHLINNNHLLSLILRKQVEKLSVMYKEERYPTSESKNLEYIYYSLKNIEKTKYDDLREMIYNEYLLGSLVKINLLEDLENNSLSSDSNAIVEKSEKTCIKIPFLPILNIEKHKYTLVLDLDETLVHYMEDGESCFVQVRPYCEFFLIEMSKYFEIVIFTAATQEVPIIYLINSMRIWYFQN